MDEKMTTTRERKFIPLPDPCGIKSEIAFEATELKGETKEFVIGDLHYFDTNIILYGPRDFDSVEEMNQFMIDHWNSVVTNNDTVFVLGDFFDFDNCTDDEMCSVLDNLQGNIILIAGNHDRGHLDRIRNYGIEVIEYPIIKDGFWFLSHEPMFVTEAAPYANIFAHVHLNPMYRTVSTRSFCVSAERIGYTPILLSRVKELVRKEAVLKNELSKSNNVVLFSDAEEDEND